LKQSKSDALLLEVGDDLLRLIPSEHRPLICACGLCSVFRKARQVERMEEATPPSPYAMTGLGWGDPRERRRIEEKGL
jgi:hypothetical protein